MSKEHPKRSRIKGFKYKGSYFYFLTICTNFRKPILTSNEIINKALDILKLASQEFHFQVYAYCFMPDHLHLLLVAKNHNVSLTDFVKSFKQKTSYHYKQRYGNKLWQPSYYDHVVRKNENLNKIAEYIFFNPVRGVLVSDYRKYPFLGSFMFDVAGFS